MKVFTIILKKGETYLQVVPPFSYVVPVLIFKKLKIKDFLNSIQECKRNKNMNYVADELISFFLLWSINLLGVRSIIFTLLVIIKWAFSTNLISMCCCLHIFESKELFSLNILKHWNWLFISLTLPVNLNSTCCSDLLGELPQLSCKVGRPFACAGV